MPKAYIMLGRIAAGKSYYAEKIAQEEGGIILSCDELIRSVFDSCLGEKLPETEERAIKYLLTLAKQIGKTGQNVVFDCGLFSKEARSFADNQLKLFGFETERILIKADETIRHDRLNRRNLKRAGSRMKMGILPYEKVLEIEAERYAEPAPSEYDKLIINE